MVTSGKDMHFCLPWSGNCWRVHESKYLSNKISKQERNSNFTFITFIWKYFL